MTNWLRTPVPRSSAELKFFVFHHAGGSSAVYLKWAKFFPPEIELSVLELPGRATRFREPPVEDIKALIKTLSDEISPLLDRPYLFFGHSMGALLAYFLAENLPRSERRLLKGLGLSACFAPLREKKTARNVIADLPEPEFLRRISGFADLPQALLQNREALDYFLAILRSDLRLIDSIPGCLPNPHGPASIVFQGASDLTYTTEQLREWSSLVTLKRDVVIYRGSHFYLFENPRQVIQATLDTLAPEHSYQCVES